MHFFASTRGSVPQNGSVLKNRCPCRVSTCPGRGCLFDRDPTLVPDLVPQEPDRRSLRTPLLWAIAIVGGFAGALSREGVKGTGRRD
jgi:hypothetical protein